MPVKSKQTTPSPDAAAKEWIALKAEKERLEKRLEDLKTVLEPFLLEQPKQSAELHGFKFSLVENSRENFQLSKAKEKIDGRVLAPYITRSTYTQIRTTWKGSDEAAA